MNQRRRCVRDNGARLRSERTAIPCVTDGASPSSCINLASSARLAAEKSILDVCFIALTLSSDCWSLFRFPLSSLCVLCVSVVVVLFVSLTTETQRHGGCTEEDQIRTSSYIQPWIRRFETKLHSTSFRPRYH